eukprot:SAG11_NODE_3866_length_2181_cov_2.315082_2_plen_172_part_00
MFKFKIQRGLTLELRWRHRARAHLVAAELAEAVVLGDTVADGVADARDDAAHEGRPPWLSRAAVQHAVALHADCRTVCSPPSEALHRQAKRVAQSSLAMPTPALHLATCPEGGQTDAASRHCSCTSVALSCSCSARQLQLHGRHLRCAALRWHCVHALQLPRPGARPPYVT